MRALCHLIPVNEQQQFRTTVEVSTIVVLVQPSLLLSLYVITVGLLFIVVGSVRRYCWFVVTRALPELVRCRGISRITAAAV